MKTHGRVGEYLDGALAADEKAAFLDHLAECAECQAEVHGEVQLRDREDALRGAAARQDGTAGARGLTEALDSRVAHGRAGEYLDGALDGRGEASFLDHLAACADCQRELHAEIQLRDREDLLREAPAEAGVRRGSPTRRARATRGAWWAGVAGALAAAATAAIVIMPPPPSPAAPILVVAPKRAIEIRLSHRAAAEHRPYDTMRAAAIPRESIARGAIDQFANTGDCHGVADAYVLAGEWVRAEEEFGRCPAGPALDADRAGLAVLRSDFRAAIELTERVLDGSPEHAVALWNRALALRGLGLELSAAAAFDRAAEIEASRAPGWAREARERATAVRAGLERMRTSYDEINRLGRGMVASGAPVPSALAREVPVRARVLWHEAIRTATTPARLDELAPLAAAVEASGRAGTGIARYLAQARSRLSSARAAASAEYQALYAAHGTIADRGWARWRALAARAGDDDLILGAQILTKRLDGAPLPERLAAATGDPWFQLAIDLERVKAALNLDQVEDAGARLAALQARCPPGALSFRCMQVAAQRARLALARHQPSEARDQALIALAMSRQLGEWEARGQALGIAGDAERFGGDFAMADAYYEEFERSRDACGARAAAFTTSEIRFERHQLASASARAASAPACDRPAGAQELTLLVRLLRAGHPVLGRTDLVAAIAAARSASANAKDRPYLDLLAALAELDEDPTAGDRLDRAGEDAQTFEGALPEKVMVDLYRARFADAGRRAAWGEALAIAARARGVVTPSRCALAFGADDFRFAAIAVGPDGAIDGSYQPDLPRPAEWLAPALMRSRLVGCEDIAVLALPPWLGIGPVLDPELPFHYVLGAPRSPAAGAPRHVVVAEPATPLSAGLAPLAPRTWPSSGPNAPDELITGPEATPERVLAAMADATLVEIHSHTTWLDKLDAPALALATGAGGWSLGTAQLRSAKLTRAPVIVLADCAGGVPARFQYKAWGLPLVLRAAGASAVIASLAPLPDGDAMAFFDAVTVELVHGASPAAAVARVRAEKIKGDSTSWMRQVVVFQ